VRQNMALRDHRDSGNIFKTFLDDKLMTVILGQFFDIGP